MPATGRLTGTELAVLTAGSTIAFGGLVSLVLAQLGVWQLVPVLLAFAVLPLTSLASWRRIAPRPTSDRWFPWYLAALAIVFLAIVLPGNRVSIAGIDPGVYLRHSQVIAEQGRLSLDDPAVTLGLDDVDVLSADYPALDPSPISSGELDFAFYHFYPALSAPAYALGRSLGVSFVSPIVGLLGVLAAGLVMRRLAGSLAAVCASAFLASSAVWTFFSDWNGSEIPVATLFLCGTLAGLASHEHDGRAGLALSGLSGALVAAGVNSRADGFLLMALCSCVLGAMALLGHRRRALAAVAGATIPSAIWVIQTYVTSPNYARAHIEFGWPIIALSVVAPVALGLAIGPRLRRFASPALVRRLRLVAMILFVLMLVAFALRAATAEPGQLDPLVNDSFNPFAIERIGWFLGPAGIALLALGLVQLGRDHSWRTVAVVLPGLMLTPLYLWDQRISARLMWAMRRFVPSVWPTAALIVGLGAALALAWVPRRGRPWATAALVVILAGPQLRWTLPLHDDREWSGGLDAPRQVLDSHAADTVYLWIPGQAYNAFVVPLLVENDGEAVLTLDADATPADISEVAALVAPKPVVVLADNPDRLDDLDLVLDRSILIELQRLRPTHNEVPTEIHGVRYQISMSSPIEG